MSSHTIPLGPADSIAQGPPGFLDLLAASIRRPDRLAEGPPGTLTVVYDTDLTAAEQTTLADVIATTRTREMAITLAEYQAIKSDLAALRTFVGVATPTAAQTAAAAKSIVRVLAALLRS